MTLLTALLIIAAAPAAKPAVDVAKFDVTDAQKKSMQVLSDGKGHFVVFATNENKMPDTGVMFYGDGKALYQLRVPSSGSDSGEGTWSSTMWEPRESWGQVGLEKKTKGEIVMSCGSRKANFTKLADAEAKPVIDGATFFNPRWTRLPYRLARDDKGNYYFVDYLRPTDADYRNPGPKRDLRLYVGPRGKLKLQAMTNVVSDSEGEIFSTKTGELRLVSNPGDTKWIQGKKETKLLDLPVEDNVRMIYTELGVYDRELLGTPCDDI